MPSVSVVSAIILLFVSSELVFAINRDGGKCDQSGDNLYFCFGYTSLPTNLDGSKLKMLTMNQEENNLGKLSTGELLRANLPKLEKLILGKCKIQYIEIGAFQGGDKLTVLHLGNNLITDLYPSVFSDLPNLEKLWLTGNPLKFSENAEFPQLNLKQLHLMRCQLKSIEVNLFKNLNNLELLDLNDNQLVELNWISPSLNNLRSLSSENNQLTSLDGIGSLRNLTGIYLSGNKFTTIDWRLLLPLKRLREITLYWNPFHCDCHMGSLLKLFDQRKIDLAGASWTWCMSGFSFAGNYTLAGKKVVDIDLNELSCPPAVSHLKMVTTDKTATKEVIKCHFSGFPIPEVKWLKNGETLKNGTEGIQMSATTVDFQIEAKPDLEQNGGVEEEEFANLRNDFSQALIIKYFNESDDFGEYECFVSNLAGNSSKTLSKGSIERKEDDHPNNTDDDDNIINLIISYFASLFL